MLSLGKSYKATIIFDVCNGFLYNINDCFKKVFYSLGILIKIYSVYFEIILDTFHFNSGISTSWIISTY